MLVLFENKFNILCENINTIFFFKNKTIFLPTRQQYGYIPAASLITHLT